MKTLLTHFLLFSCLPNNSLLIFHSIVLFPHFFGCVRFFHSAVSIAMFPFYFWFLAPHRFFPVKCTVDGIEREKKKTNVGSVTKQARIEHVRCCKRKWTKQRWPATLATQYDITSLCVLLSMSLSLTFRRCSFVFVLTLPGIWPISSYWPLTLLNTLAWMLCIHKGTAFSNGKERVNEWQGAREAERMRA